MSLLNEIQQKLKVPKGQYNSFAKYNYRNAEDILEAVKPLLGVGTLTVSDEVIQVGERYYVKATARLEIFSDRMQAGDMQPVDVWEATGWAREELDKKGMDAAQITGAASSYARKYALNGLFCIDDTKDADTQDNSAKPAATVPQNAPKQPYGMSVAQKVKADKDRVLSQLKMLKLVGDNPTKEECEKAVLENTGLPLIDSKMEEIGARLATIIEEIKAK